jgi:hypothetical protein
MSIGPVTLPGPREILADLCGDETDGTVVVVGRVSAATRRVPIQRAKVWAEWTELRESTEPGDNHGRVVVESEDTRTNRNGYYALCDVPVGLDIVLHALDDFAGSGATRVRTARPVNVADIVIRWPRPSGR